MKDLAKRYWRGASKEAMELARLYRLGEISDEDFEHDYNNIKMLYHLDSLLDGQNAFKAFDTWLAIWLITFDENPHLLQSK